MYRTNPAGVKLIWLSEIKQKTVQIATMLQVRAQRINQIYWRWKLQPSSHNTTSSAEAANPSLALPPFQSGHLGPLCRAAAATAALLIARAFSRQMPSLLRPLPLADSRCPRPVYESPQPGHLHRCYDSLHHQPAMLNRRSDLPLNRYGRPGPCHRRRCISELPLHRVTFCRPRPRAKRPTTVVNPRVPPRLF